MSWQRSTHEPGWLAPLKLIAGAAALLLVRVAFVWPGSEEPATQLAFATTWTVFLIVAGIPTFLICVGSFRYLLRHDRGVVARPEWWFEVAQLYWIVCLFSAFAVPAFLFGPGGPAGELAQQAVPLLLWFAGGAFGAFFTTASFAYVLAIIHRSDLSGQTRECVHFFYMVVGLITLLVASVAWCPPGAAGPRGIYLSTFIAMVIVGLISACVEFASQARSRSRGGPWRFLGLIPIPVRIRQGALNFRDALNRLLDPPPPPRPSSSRVYRMLMYERGVEEFDED